MSQIDRAAVGRHASLMNSEARLNFQVQYFILKNHQLLLALHINDLDEGTKCHISKSADNSELDSDYLRGTWENYMTGQEDGRQNKALRNVRRSTLAKQKSGDWVM